MAPATRRLGDVIEETIRDMQAQNLEENTLRVARIHFDAILGHFSNIQMKYIDSTKVSEFFAIHTRKGESVSTLNARRQWLGKLIETARLRRYMQHDPMGHIKAFKGQPRKHVVVPEEEFDFLLDCAPYGSARAAVALGLYQFHRIGETADMKVGDVDLESRLVHKLNHKSKTLDDLPISEELDRELRRWLTEYTRDCGPLDPDWYLIPRQNRMMPRRQDDGTYKVVRDPGRTLYQPNKKINTAHRLVQAALEKAGYPTHDPNGKSHWEGGHTLRRSGARALYYRLLDDNGHESANQVVQAMLGHAHFSTTERYIGVTLAKSRRNALIAGKPMFPKAKVVSLSQHREAKGE